MQQVNKQESNLVEAPNHFSNSMETGPVLEGRWNDDEHQRFLKGIMEFGKDWKEVEKIVKTRTGSQVRSHAQKYFIKLHNLQKERKRQKSRISSELAKIEDEVLKQFTEDDISPKTPVQLIALIRKADQQLDDQSFIDSEKVYAKNLMKEHQVRHSKKERQHGSKKKEKNSKGQSLFSKQSQDLTEAKNLLENFSFQQMGQVESSFLLWVMKNKSGYQFRDLIDFEKAEIDLKDKDLDARSKAQAQGQKIEESEVTGVRKRSFTLFEEEQDEEKLNRTLEKVREGKNDD